MTVAIPELAITYAVVWDHLGIIKVGRAWKMSRLRRLTSTGARVVMLWRETPAGFERYALRELAQHFPRAFANAEESEIALPHGRGWTECFRVTAQNVRDAMRTIFRGVARYERDQKAAKRPSAHVQRRGAGGTAAGREADRDRAALLRRRRGPRPSEPATDQDQPGAIRRRDHRGRDPRPPDEARGSRLHPPLRRERPQLPGTPRVASDRPRHPIPDPPTTRPDGAREHFARPSRDPREGVGGPPRGSGGGGREEGGRRGGRGRRWTRGEGGACPPAHQRTVTLLPQAPALRNRTTMRWLRCSTHQALPLGEGSDRRGSRRPRRANGMTTPTTGGLPWLLT